MPYRSEMTHEEYVEHVASTLKHGTGDDLYDLGFLVDPSHAFQQEISPRGDREAIVEYFLDTIAENDPDTHELVWEEMSVDPETVKKLPDMWYEESTLDDDILAAGKILEPFTSWEVRSIFEQLDPNGDWDELDYDDDGLIAEVFVNIIEG